ncbi:DUF2461 domain-containing protein [Prevotella sp. HUN102]|uniref:DUF2461 domain-containing protein n=1 Tax=Prevotella sp. HUN102 TaxID=1392486 RepID=UPI00048E7732|nr:DUF2461 domain-containing protein [Prevotella sp. HUN102]
MNTKQINKFLKDIAANNNRDWFQEHKKEYDSAKKDFEAGIAQAIRVLSTFDDEVSHLEVKDCTYRFYRDIRFSPDKNPYKRHFGAFICAKGRKALRGGYYLHIQPGNCMIAIGSYWLPTNILTSCRNEIMANIDQWRKIVEDGRFVKTFGYPNEGYWENEKVTSKGFGLSALKTIPKGFPRDYEFAQYLRMKDYCCWIQVPDDFFEGDKWMDKFVEICKIGKPMMDFMNAVIDDYE